MRYGVVWIATLCLLVWGALVTNAQGDDPVEVAAQAARAYAASDFNTAFVLYEDLIEAGVADSAVYFNLATVYEETDSLGYALVNYRRAQVLSPRDLDIALRIVDVQANRLDVQSEETIIIDRLGSAVSGLVTRTELGIVSFALWTGWFALVTLVTLRANLRLPLRPVIVVLGVIALAAVILLASRLYVDAFRPRAVVVVPETPVVSGPGEDYLLLYELAEAAEMRVVRQENNYSRIVTPDGRLGWLPTEAIELATIP